MSSQYLIFVKGLEKHIYKTFDSLLKQSEAEEQAIITKHLETNLRGEIRISEIGEEINLSLPRIFSAESIIKYSILSWYLPSWTRFELQEFLRKKCTQQRFFEIEALYLYSKELMLFTLFRENDCRTNHLFGNILQRGILQNINTPTGKRRVRVDDFVYLSSKKRKLPKKKVYKRGYNDHGSLPPWDKKAREEANMDLQAFTYQLTKKREQLLAKSKQLKLLALLAEGVDS